MSSGSIEMHVHTRAGSADSSITVDELGARAVVAGVGGIVVAEHFRVWSDWERDAFFDRWGVRIYRAIEATTDIGHVIVLWAPAGMSPPHDGRALLYHARHEGMFTILAHPFRYYFDSVHSGSRPVFKQGATAEELAGDEIFSLVDAVEIENGGCNDRENAMAIEVAKVCGLPVTIGSDAHHVHELGRITLPVPEIPKHEGDMIELISGFTLPSMMSTERKPLQPLSGHE
jgi:histidinol phosphatase-like PHP family hydrolase